MSIQEETPVSQEPTDKPRKKPHHNNLRKKPERQSRRMSKAKWSEAAVLYASGEYRPTDLCIRYGVTRQAFHAMMKKMGVKRGEDLERTREEQRRVLREKSTISVEEQAQRVFDTRNDHYKYNVFLAQRMMRIIGKTLEDNVPVSTVAEDVKTIREAAQALEILGRNRFQSIGINAVNSGDGSTILESLPILQMTDDDIEDVQLKLLGAGSEFDVDDTGEVVYGEAEEGEDDAP